MSGKISQQQCANDPPHYVELFKRNALRLNWEKNDIKRQIFAWLRAIQVIYTCIYIYIRRRAWGQIIAEH